MLVGAFGDIGAAELEKKLEGVLGGLAPGGTKPEMPLIDVARKASWTVIPKEVDQSAIAIGHAGGVRVPTKMDEYAELICMNEILGGGSFTSRLMLVVRSDMGLAYDVHSTLGLDYDHPGTFQLYCGTKSETTVKAIKAMLAEVEKLRTNLATEEELAVAKESILNQVPFWIDTTEKVIDRTLNYEYHGFPQDTLKRFTDALAKVTREQVLKAAQSYIHPEAFTLVVCGQSKDFDAPIDSLAAGGKVETIEDPAGKPGMGVEHWAHPGSAAEPAPVKKPEGQGEAEKKPEGKTPEGKADEGASKPAGDDKAAAALLAKVVEASGGKKALDALTGIHLKQKIVVSAQGQTQTVKIDYTLVFPDKARVEIQQGPQKMSQILDGKQGWVVMGGVHKLAPPQVAQMRGQIDQALVSPLLKAAASGTATASIEGENVDFYGKPSTKLAIKKGHASTTFFVDPATGVLLGRVEENQMGELKVKFEGAKPCGGVLLPMQQDARAADDAVDAKPVLKTTIEVAEPNPKTDETTFAEPKAEKGADGGDDDGEDEAPKKGGGGKKGGEGD
jgi:hypothetical protein